MSFVSPHEVIQFHNCKILRDHKIIKEDLWVRNQKIIDPEPLFFDEQKVADVQIDCAGALIAPGFIDLQVNGGYGIDFSHNTENVEEGLDKVAKGLLSTGVTSFCPTLVTSPIHRYHDIIPHIKKVNGSQNGAGILGIHLEGPFINKEKKGAHPVQYIRSFEKGFEDVVEVYGNLEDVTLVTLAPELDPTGEVIKELKKRSINVSIGHSMANLNIGEDAINSGANLITHLFNAMLPFHHRDPGLVGLLTSSNVPANKPLYYGIISDGIHTHPAALRIAYRSCPKGLILVTDAMSALGFTEGIHTLGQQKVEIKNLAAYVAGTDSLAGSIAPMDLCVRFFKGATRCSTVEALECASLHPAQMMGISQTKGTLDFNTDGDFIMLDDDLQVISTYISGKCVWERDNSQCKVKYSS